jgi:hypothetical protein
LVVLVGGGVQAASHDVLEPEGIHCLWIRVEPVAMGLGRDGCPAATGAGAVAGGRQDGPAHRRRGAVLDLLAGGGRGRRVGPDGIDYPLRGDRPPQVDQQHGQDGLLPAPRQLQGPINGWSLRPVGRNLSLDPDGAQDSEVQGASP